ncbi:MAG TPA: phosphonate ABC transporter, permease protein PhnE [Roseomonas sp.]|nr:phosphonate ABC transporter, permease protein PhnE [Roseomonas sp.]
MSVITTHLPAVRRGEAAYQTLRRQRRRASLAGLGVLAICFVAAAWISEFYPSSLAAGLPRIGEYFHRILPTLHAPVLFAGVKTEGSLAFWFYRLDSWLLLLLQTAQMAALATLGGAAVALLMAFPAARNLAPSRWLHHLTRRGLEATRTVPEIVYALIFVWAFGVGPLAGILAIGLHTAGALGKLFSEVVENAPMQAWDGMRASGANWAQACRYAILPQVAPNLLSYALLRFEINLRGATVIGFVGAGGIGQELYQVIAFNYYEEISAIVVLVILSVMLIDLLSERLRHRLIHAAGAR